MIVSPILYTIEDASRILNIKVSRLRSAIFKREIGHIKLNRLIRFTQTNLEEWIKKGEIRN